MLERQATSKQASKQATTSELDDDTGRAAEGDRGEEEEEHNTTVEAHGSFPGFQVAAAAARFPFLLSKITADSTAQEEQEQEEHEQ